jgi:hypothetical protein
MDFFKSIEEIQILEENDSYLGFDVIFPWGYELRLIVFSFGFCINGMMIAFAKDLFLMIIPFEMKIVLCL